MKSSKIFETFLTNNHLQDQLLQTAKNTNEQEHDIVEMLIDIINNLGAQLQDTVCNEMFAIFGLKKVKKITTYGKKISSEEEDKKIEKLW